MFRCYCISQPLQQLKNCDHGDSSMLARLQQPRQLCKLGANIEGLYRSECISSKFAWEKKGAHYLVHGDMQNGSTRYWNYLEDNGPCAGGLSAVNTIGTQLLDPIHLGTDPMEYCMAVLNY